MEPAFRFLSHRWQLSAAVVGILIAAGVLFAFAKKRETSKQIDEKAPITIAASCVGRFASGYSWYLSVNSAGQAALTIDSFPNQITRRFDVFEEQLQAFRNALIRERFFDLADEYGEHVPDGSTTTATVTIGEITRTVRVRFLMNWVDGDKTKLQEPSRAIRVMMPLRGWFADSAAVDLSKYDQMVLNAVSSKPSE